MIFEEHRDLLCELPWFSNEITATMTFRFPLKYHRVDKRVILKTIKRSLL